MIKSTDFASFTSHIYSVSKCLKFVIISCKYTIIVPVVCERILNNSLNINTKFITQFYQTAIPWLAALSLKDKKIFNKRKLAKFEYTERGSGGFKGKWIVDICLKHFFLKQIFYFYQDIVKNEIHMPLDIDFVSGASFIGPNQWPLMSFISKAWLLTAHVQKEKPAIDSIL